MTQEEKAKAYDIALDKIKMLLGTGSNCSREELEYVFPELKESEDERIRKELIDFVKSRLAGFPDCKRFTDWLERQGEHANFRNKIQIGDKVTKNRDGVLVNLSQLNRVAKVEEKQGEQKPTDEEMKELLQTEYEKGRADAIAEMQKSWSDEDEDVLEDVEEAIINYWHGQSQEDLLDWLKSLKERVTPQPKQEWSEEDEEHIKSLLERLEGMCKKDATFIRTKFAVSEDEDWLKSLSPQSRWKPSDRDIKLLRELSDGKICPDNYRTRLYEIINNLKFL